MTPRARREGIDGVTEEANGTRVLKVAVKAAPEGGKANEAVASLLAKAWRVPKSAITVAAGASGRRKILDIAGDPADLEARILGSLERDR